MKSSTAIILAAIVVLLGILAFSLMQAPERRTPSEKFGDVVESLGDGVKDASRAAQDRTPAEKISDGVSDVKEDIKNSIN